MIAEIISTGTELLSGEVLNTNTQYISKRLQQIGVDVRFHTATTDEREKINQVLEIAYDRSDLIIITGGLGPTDDDITKEVVAKFLDLEMYEDHIELERIRNYFINANKPMTENNRKQALIFKGAQWLINDYGTASGVGVKYKGKTIILLPGPPFEMKPMFEKYIFDYVLQDDYWINYSLNVIGIGESEIETRIKSSGASDTNLCVATFTKMGYIQVKIFGRGDKVNASVMKREAQRIIAILRKEFGKSIISEDDNTIEETIINILKKNSKVVSFVESCTGGQVVSRLINIPGASNVIDRGIVSYSKNAKSEELNIPMELINSMGLYNEDFVKIMAEKLKKKTKSDITLATSGITTPIMSDESKSGQLFVAICIDKNTYVRKFEVRGSREYMITRMSTYALSFLLYVLNDSINN
ncbi:MAG: competence/damage-inducible protein A [Tissierellia bacterium]|nr:competence/damage-inducible protein A [Tissierellia bacterium]